MRGVEMGLIGHFTKLRLVAQRNHDAIEREAELLKRIEKCRRAVEIIARLFHSPFPSERENAASALRAGAKSPEMKTTPVRGTGVGVLEKPQQDGCSAFSFAAWT